MDLQLIVALLMTVLPVIELRGGLPLIVDYCLKNGLNILPYFLIVVVLNCLVIFFIYFFMDFLHEHFMKLRFYRRFMDHYLEKVRIKSKKIEKHISNWGFVALALFVAVPLPGTGAWTGTIVAWILGLERKKSVVAISLGVLIAGIIVLTLSLSALGFFYK